MFANIKTFSYTRSMAEARRPARLLYARSIELKTRSCNELISGFYRAPFSVLSPSVGKPNCRTAFSVLLEQFGALHNSKAFPRLELFTPVETTTLNCTHKRLKDPKWRPEVSSLHDLVCNSMDRSCTQITTLDTR